MTTVGAGNPRISGRRGQITDLNVDFYRNGVLSDPFALRKVEIYSDQVLPHNLVAVLPFPEPTGTYYPLPSTKLAVGSYVLPWLSPVTVPVPNVYHDVWYYYQDDPCIDTACDLDDVVLLPSLLSTCHRFWLYPDQWFTDDSLQSVQFGFEPLNQRFNTPERRNLEIGLMPLPLYDFDYNLVMPMVPFLVGSITVQTRFAETIVDEEAMTIGLRQGSYRTNPFVMRWLMDTSRFIIGTYRYRVTIMLPNGLTQTSPWYILTVN